VNKFLKKNWFNILIGIVIAINIFFLAHNFVTSKRRKANNTQLIKEKTVAAGRGNWEQRPEFYNTPYPDIALTSINGEIINLKDLIGSVIIIKFSKFYKKDLPDLVYLEHLAGKFRREGVSLIFINSLGKHYKEAINKICIFSSPIIEDDGSVLGLFNANTEETVIVDRNFTVKFKSNINYIFNKSLIYNELIKWTF